MLGMMGSCHKLSTAATNSELSPGEGAVLASALWSGDKDGDSPNVGEPMSESGSSLYSMIFSA